MENILTFIPKLKIFYLLLIIFIMIIVNIIINKRNINNNYRYFINGITLIIISLLTSYYNDIIEGIFRLNFLSVKFYIVILIIINVITLITIQKDLKPVYKIINYTMFSIVSLILGIILLMIVGIKLGIISTIFSKYTIMLLNISIIVFIIYLTIISFIYIVKNLNNVEITFDKEKLNQKISSFKTFIFNKIKSIKEKQNSNNETEKESINRLTPEELLSYEKKEDFSINGIDCSIIFEDSIPENIIKNYHILSEDIDAKMVNGYTLKENILLKSICTKLKVNNLNYIDISNLSILNKITVEEYNFLKQFYEE